MWVLRSDRRELTDLILSGGEGTWSQPVPLQTWNLPPLAEDDLYLLWAADPRNQTCLPCVIVIATGHLRDFLAWASTYFISYRPITAYFRVIEFDRLDSLISVEHSPSLEGIETACMGLIIAETLRLLSSSGKFALLAPIVCSGMISYALVRAMALGAESTKIDSIRDKCLMARKLTGQTDRRDEAIAVSEICGILLSLGSNQRTSQGSLFLPPSSEVLSNALMELKTEGRISDYIWLRMVGDVEELRGAHQYMENTREERVRYFQKVAVGGYFEKLPNILGGFVSGYLASLIGPGSLAHIDLLINQVRSLPTAPLWYGVCGGLQKKNEVLSSHNALGRRLLRDLLRAEPFLAPPISDISLPELQVLLEGKDRLVEFPRFASNRALVEVEPLVSFYIQWPKREASQEMRQRTSLFDRREEPVPPRGLLEDLEFHLQNALQIQKKLIEKERAKPTESKSGWKQKRKK